MAFKTHFVAALALVFVCIQISCNRIQETKLPYDALRHWQATNLNVRTFSNGDSIPFIEDSIIWANVNYPACCAYDNNPASADTFGLLYNWFAVNDSRGLCPKGWRVATLADWDSLVTVFGGDSIAARHLKDSLHWIPFGYPGDNSSGLGFVPGGNRRDDGGFNGKGSSAPIWTANEVDSFNAIARFMNTKHYRVGTKTGSKKNALACRCVKE